jgi:hypothetical protein
MTLDSINLRTSYGWRLSYVDGHLSHPARKNIKIMGEWSTSDKDRVWEAKKITVTLIQKFTTKALMATGVGYIKTLLENNPVHTVLISEHSLEAFSAVVRDGVKVNNYGLMAEMKITFTKITV